MTEAWERRVVENVTWWDEWGCSLPNPRGTLPVVEYRAYLAILRGRAQRRDEEAKKAKRQAERGRR